jgi:hypothetical protein
MEDSRSSNVSSNAGTITTRETNVRKLVPLTMAVGFKNKACT